MVFTAGKRSTICYCPGCDPPADPLCRVAGSGRLQRTPGPERPEAWAMYYFTATSFMSGFGEAPEQVSVDVRLAVESPRGRMGMSR